jgi:hypothetical protein
VDDKCLQYGKTFKYLGCEISYENDKDIQQKLATFAQILGILNNIFKPNFFQKFSRIEVHNPLAVPIFCMEAKFGPLGGRGKGIRSTWHHSKLIVSEEQSGTPLLTTKGINKF